MKWPWHKEVNGDDVHARPNVERASAELLGRLEALCVELEKLVEEEETHHGNGDDAS